MLWLIRKSPSQRPSAAELLASHLLPPRIGLDRAYLTEVTDVLIRNASQEVNAQIIDAIFKRRGYNEAVDSGYDGRLTALNFRLLRRRSARGNQDAVAAADMPYFILKSRLEGELQTIFELFGAVRVPSPLLEPARTHSEVVPSTAVELLDSAGTKVNLPRWVRCSHRH